MARAELRIKSNDALIELSERNPEVTFEVMGGWPSGGKLRVLIKAFSDDISAVQHSIEEIPLVTDVGIRQIDEGFIIFEISTPMPEPHGAMTDSGIVPTYPLTLHRGWFSGELMAPTEKLTQFRNELDRGDIEYQLDKLTPDRPSSNLLTTRQRELIETASDEGYYAIPRQCTVSELASQFDVNKSVVSRVLRRAEARIVLDYLE